MNKTANAQRVESVNSSCSQTAVEQSERSHYDAERSRYLTALTVLSEMTETLGTTFVPDLFSGLERKPAYLEATWELFRDEVGLEDLDAQTRRIVALAITTNESGTYQIAALPHAFRLSPVGPRRCETIESIIRMIHAFECYLFDVAPVHAPAIPISGMTVVPTLHRTRRPK
jgi:hypothetical protein